MLPIAQCILVIALGTSIRAQTEKVDVEALRKKYAASCTPSSSSDACRQMRWKLEDALYADLLLFMQDGETPPPSAIEVGQNFFVDGTVIHSDESRVTAPFLYVGNTSPGVYNFSNGLINAGSVIVGNVLAGGDSRVYPAGNVFPSVADLMKQFENVDAGDFRLIGGSSLRGLSQGTAGVDFDEMAKALQPGPHAIPRQ